MSMKHAQKHVGTCRKIKVTATTYVSRSTKKTEVNLNYFRNDLDIWLHQVVSWLDNDKKNPSNERIKTFAIEVIQKLLTRRVNIIKH